MKSGQGPDVPVVHLQCTGIKKDICQRQSMHVLILMLMRAGNDKYIAALNGELSVVNRMNRCAAQNDNQLVKAVSVEWKFWLRVADINLQRQGRVVEIILFFKFLDHGAIVLKDVRIVKEMCAVLC